MAEVASAPIPGGSALTLPLALPSTLHLPALSTALASTNPPKPIDEAYLRAPDEALVLHLYSTILQLPALREASAALEREKAERARRDIEVEEALNEAESVRTEAEERAERERAERERAEAEKDRLAAELAGSNAQLAALKSTSESGTSEVAELKGRLEQVEQEKRDLLSSLEKEREESSRRGGECVDGRGQNALCLRVLGKATSIVCSHLLLYAF